MYKEPTLSKPGVDIKSVSPVSIYQPSEEVKDVTALVTKDYQYGWIIMTKNRPEFNDRSIISEVNVNQKAFNSYVPPKSENPDDSWRAQTVRPVTRNKLISIAAHVTATILYPNVFAQNDKDEEDKDAAMVMRDLIEWAIENSDYSRTFIMAVISALVDPAVIVKAEFAQVYRTIKEMQDDGSYSKKEIIDEVLSGFQQNVVPVKNLLIANFYEPNIQKQRFVIEHKYVDYEEARQVYGMRANFKYVKPGVRSVFHEETKTFYDVQDEELKDYLVHEVTYYNRAMDVKIIFVNGIIMTAPDAPNPRKNKDYPFAKSGYEPINNGMCFYYKSCANKLGSDQDIVDTLYNMVLDGTFMSLMPPMALYGSEEIDSSVTIPGMVTSFRDPNSKLENIGPKVDLRAGLESIGLVERSMSESSQDSLRGGNAQSGSRTAREVLLLEQNARIALGLFGKMIGFLVEDLGKLLMGDILQHMTVGEVSEITDDMKFKSFILPDKMVESKKVTKKLQFMNPAEINAPTSPEDAIAQSFDIMAEEGGPNSDKKIYKINPEIFRNLKYKVKAEVDELTPKSKALEKALMLEAYDRAIQNPVADQEAVSREFLFDVYKPGEADKFIKKSQPAQVQGGGTQAPFQQKGVSTSMLSQLTGSNSLGTAASSLE